MIFRLVVRLIVGKALSDHIKSVQIENRRRQGVPEDRPRAQALLAACRSVVLRLRAEDRKLL